jgi:hypothetical protein
MRRPMEVRREWKMAAVAEMGVRRRARERVGTLALRREIPAGR